MRTSIRFSILALVGLSLLSPPKWRYLEGYGWASRMEERKPHDACALCFTVPNGYNPYQIYEYLVSDRPEKARIISRMLPNPAPGVNKVTRAAADKGETTWYIGTQGYVGPTDEAPGFHGTTFTHIELIRIMERHHRVFSRMGAWSYGLGGSGFHATIDPRDDGCIADIPKEIEGVPLTVEYGPCCPDAS